VRVLAWSEFGQPWVVYDEGFGPKPLMLHLARFEQLMNVSELGSKVSFLRACINSNFCYVNVYKFGLHGV